MEGIGQSDLVKNRIKKFSDKHVPDLPKLPVLVNNIINLRYKEILRKLKKDQWLRK